MKLIGITGMAGSGRTTVAKILAEELELTHFSSPLEASFSGETEAVVDNVTTEEEAEYIRRRGVLIHVFRKETGYNGEGAIPRKNQDYLILNQDISLERLTEICKGDVVYDVTNILSYNVAWGLEEIPPPTYQPSHSEMVTNLVKPGEDILKTLSGDTCNIIHMTMGISGEAGELLDAVKKYTIYNKPLDHANVIEELGDLEFYMEGLRQALCITREETLAANIAKLGKRYKAGSYSNEAAIAREDKQEEQPAPNLMTPTYYTYEEGGTWLEWKGGELNMTELTQLRIKYNSKSPKILAVPCANGHNVSIHALKFDTDETWDCINGWRGKDFKS